MGCSAEELAMATAEDAFEEADLNRDGHLSFDEFQLWTEMDVGVAALEVAERVASKLPITEIRCGSSQDV